MSKKLFLILLSSIFQVKASLISQVDEKDKSVNTSILPESIIGTDDRVPSNDPRVGRIMPIGCTGWLISAGCILTAGHCASDGGIDDMQELQFNVPASQLNGTPNPPISTKDIYPIIKQSIVYTPTYSIGNDWCIFQVGLNSSGESVFKNQKHFFRIIDDYSAFGTNPLVRITGYGVDNEPFGSTGSSNSRSQTEQTDTGIIDHRSTSPNSDAIYYSVDTLGGNSGSPVFLEGTHMAIAIHTNGGSGLNKGTGFQNSLLVNAIENFYSTSFTYVDSNYFATVSTGNGSLFQPYRKLEDAVTNASTGTNLGLVAGYYANPGIIFPLGKAVTIKALAGKIYIGGILPK